jgi:hypothetical protein
MRPLLFALSFLLLLPQAAEAANLKKIFRNTLILGASVSSGKVTDGPGTRAARRFGGKVTNLAEPEQPVTDYEDDFNADYLEGYTSVIAIDLLFWDSSHFRVGPSIAKFDQLLAATSAKGIPLVIGDIPKLLSWWKQISRASLNRHIRRECVPAKHCYVLAFEDLHKQATGSGIEIGGKRYRFEELVADGLHMNAIGSNHVAGMIVDLLK